MTIDDHRSHLGLTSAEAADRRRTHGSNTVGERHHFRPIAAFFGKFNSPLLWVILGAAIVSYLTGSKTNAMILVAMTLLSVILDFVNTYRSERAIQSLVDRVQTMATVVRDGHDVSVPLADIVPGDILTLSAGGVIPADGFVLSEKDLYVNESALTGESNPVMKQVTTGLLPSIVTKDRPDAVMMGTSVVTGYARILVVATGVNTAYGAVAKHLQDQPSDTVFERELRSFSMFLMRVTLIMVVVVFLLNLVGVGHRGVFDSFVFAVAIAIGLTPELLPVIMTVSLSRGAVRMAANHVIVKRLPAIQNFGRMNVLCTDKTGTLTENRVHVAMAVNAGGDTDDTVLRDAWLSSRFHSGVENPLDQAIAESHVWPLDGIEKVDEVPFDFERRRETIVVRDNGMWRMITKGAPERVLDVCTDYRHAHGQAPLDTAMRNQLAALYDRLSREGYKLLGVATRPVGTTQTMYEPADEHGLVFSGYIALLDPAKATARAAIDDLESLGIELKILTGDGAALTEKICRDIDVPIKGTITGEQLQKIPDSQWPSIVRETSIFARIDPFQKEKIIRTLRAGGSVVGFLGDGINDAPALRAADVGVSVSNAVDVAKETADIILQEQSLAVLAGGVMEGRKTFRNTLKYIEMGLSSNFGNMLSMTVASALLPFFPMLPTQILLNNFLYDSSQLSLSSDRVDPEAVRRPSVWDIRFIRRYMLTFGPISSLFDFATFGLLWAMFHDQPMLFQTGWFIESVATQVIVIYVIRTRLAPWRASKPSRLLVLNTSAVVLLATSIPYWALGRVFGFGPLPFTALGVILIFVLAYIGLVEFVKRWFYRREDRVYHSSL